MAITTNVPSDSFEDLQRDVQDATRFTNAIEPFSNRAGLQIKPIKMIEAEANARLQSIGFVFLDPLSFATGATLTNSAHALRRSDGEYFRWSGPLPKHVQPGTDPLSDNRYIAVGSAALAQRLADPNSEQLIAGVPAKELAQGSGTGFAGRVNSIKGLLDVNTSSPSVFTVVSFYAGLKLGGGDFYYDSTLSKNFHTGGTIIAPEALSAWNGTPSDISTLLNWSGNDGFGCFVRISKSTSTELSAECFGARPGQDAYWPIIAAYRSISAGQVTLPAGDFLLSGTIYLKLKVKLKGQGAGATRLLRTPNSNFIMVVASFPDQGSDYIYLSGMTIDGNNDAGASGLGVYFHNVHVPSYIDDVTVLNCNGGNIKVERCTVVELRGIWSNRAVNGRCLEIDTFRSILISGGAYEHASNTTEHILVKNTGNYYYPVLTFNMLHIEGLLESNMCGVSIQGGSEYYAIVAVNINGYQAIGKRPGGHSSNFGLRVLNTRVAITLNGYAQTGCTSLVTGLPEGTPQPPVQAQNVTYWEYYGNKNSSYSLHTGLITTAGNLPFKILTVNKTGAIAPFTVTEQTFVIPTQPDTNYLIVASAEGFMGNNLSFYVDEESKTATQFKLKFINTTTGEPAQLLNPTKFNVLVYRAS